MWLGLPAGRFQSGGTCRMHAARARWWSSRGELRAIWPIIGPLKSKMEMAEIRHLENWRDVIFCRGWSDLDDISLTGAEWHVDCGDMVKMETRCRIPIRRTFGRIPWHVIPEPPATLQGVIIPSAILKIVFRHIFFCFFMPFGLWRAAAFVSSPIHLFIYLRQRRRYMFSPARPRPRSFVCLSVCLSVCKITEKRVYGFRWNVACRQMSGHGRTD